MMERRSVLALGTAALAAAGGVMAGPAAAATSGPSDAELARSLPGDFRSATVQAGAVRLHYVAGGQGEPLFLLHGWPQTWWEFRKVMPGLARRYRVIAVDLRGIGGSDKPAGGYDKKTMAGDILQLAHALGYKQINIAGHDIGAQVAFSFAANHPAATRKVAILDVTHPDESYYENRLLHRPGTPGISLWWHAFNQVRGLPEQLVSGRAAYLTNWMFDTFLLNKAAISSRDRAVFAAAYNHPDAIRGGNGWYQAWDQDIADLKDYGPVTAPMLGLVNEAFFDAMQAVLPKQGTDVRIEKITGAGHYFVDEQPDAVVQALTRFLG
ncbi:alpha/beta fold hydrolase [Actinomadura kijaniata]|uniref:alpha/beta fold hydrolase n=1 Tax=Actinomadura kijaniata TaxID=46161 RepID=UPI003F1E1677